MNPAPRNQPPRLLPARTTGVRPSVFPTTAPHPATVSTPTTIIPGVPRVYDRLRPGQASRRQRWRIALIIIGVVGVLSAVVLTVRAQPWQAARSAVSVGATTLSHPTANGEHDFVCAALPFARLAQTELATAPQAQAHPWYLSVILAQWGVEDHWTTPGFAGYNWANAPALAGYPALPGTRQPGIPGTFAYAATAESGVAIYVATIKGGAFAAVAAAYPAGPAAQATALGQSAWDANHYTDTGHPGSALLDTLHYYHLERLDQANAAC
ncbi:MAG: hypothetical protein H0X24_18495 [Ktedonobacterales bacterium]|nr:hypothetical protein [Ktedonobacterales bacterium]